MPASTSRPSRAPLLCSVSAVGGRDAILSAPKRSRSKGWRQTVDTECSGKRQVFVPTVSMWNIRLRQAVAAKGRPWILQRPVALTPQARKQRTDASSCCPLTCKPWRGGSVSTGRSQTAAPAGGGFSAPRAAGWGHVSKRQQGAGSQVGAACRASIGRLASQAWAPGGRACTRRQQRGAPPARAAAPR